jgi:hypothetical protein
MPDLTRFAGFRSPSTLRGDPWLTREEKISGLCTWRGIVRRGRDLELMSAPCGKRLLSEIDRALDDLNRR